MRKVQVDLQDLLNLATTLNHAGGYHTALDLTAAMIKKLTDDDIEQYCVWYKLPAGRKQGYSVEDYRAEKKALTEMRKKFKLKTK